MASSTPQPVFSLSSFPSPVSPDVAGFLIAFADTAEGTQPDFLAAPGSGTFSALARNIGTGETAVVNDARNAEFQDKVDFLSRTTETLEIRMAETLDLLRSKREDADIDDVESSSYRTVFLSLRRHRDESRELF